MLIFILVALLSDSAFGDEDKQENFLSVTDTAVEEVESDKSLGRILVTGQGEEFITNTVTPQRLSKDKVNLYKYTDVNRALKQTTGVYVREEDGFGLRPNIGLRGTNPDRSKKIVFMEDGVLAGPAPYSSPAAYFTPSMSRTEALDVYKGFSAVPYGPNSIGGTINYITHGIPGKNTQRIEASSGAFNTQYFRGFSGNTFENLSYAVSVSHLRSDGFKQIDGGGDAGFYQSDLMMKGNYKIPESRQRVEAKLSYGDENSNETYLGLSGRDLEQRPYRRYASSALDNMTWSRTAAQLSHSLEIGEGNVILTQVYRNDYQRNWKRIEGFAGSGSPTLFNVMMQPEVYGQYYDILTGSEDSASILGGSGDLIQLHNQRTYYSQGIQTKWNVSKDLTTNVKHDFELGVRVHEDQIRRNHLGDRYQMSGGSLVPSGSAMTQEAMNTAKARALSLHVIENVSVGRWVFTGMGRAERVRFQVDNDLSRSQIERNESVFAPGGAILYNLSERSSMKFSVNRGVSVAGLNDDGSEAQERSVNYEVGYKYASDSGRSIAEIIGFYNDYSNITGTCTFSSGCSGNQVDMQFNGGRAAIRGLEARLARIFQWGSLEIPVQLNTTLLNAEFRNSFESRSAEWGLGAIVEGDPLPYVPQIQYTFTVGARYRSLTQELAFIYQGESADQSAQATRQMVSGYGIVDWTGRYVVRKNTEVFARVDNLLGVDYVVSYRPFGARPGKPQSFMVGLSHTF